MMAARSLTSLAEKVVKVRARLDAMRGCSCAKRRKRACKGARTNRLEDTSAWPVFWGKSTIWKGGARGKNVLC